MIRNYVRTALRYLFRRKVYSLINILGLAIGLACSILIFLYVRDELSFDRYHANAESIYRLAFIENRDYKTVNYPITSGGIAPALLREVPDVRNAVRFMRPSDQSVAYGEKLFREKRIFYADESVFDVFSFPLVEGDPKAALAEPFTVVIGEDAAEKYFGRENPMGKTLTLGGSRDFRVTGIFREVPRNSHFAFDMLFSIKSLGQSLDEEWRPSSCYTYLLLKAGSSPSVFETTFPDFFKKYRTQSDRRVFYLQPLTRIHLHSNLEREIEPNGNIAYVKILSSVALFVLLIACLNFINLSTARSADRAKEVAVRKVAGAHQTHLVGQFLGESILTALVAVILALALIQILMPAFNRIAGKEFGLGFLAERGIIPGLAVLAVLVGAAAGAYPAFLISAFAPASVLKGKLGAASKGSGFRKALVVVQFFLSIVMIIGTIVISRQLDFLQNKNLGFDKEQVVVVSMEDGQAQKAYPALKAELLGHSAVLSVSAGTNIPGMSINHDAFLPEGHAEKETIGHILVDHDYLRTLGLTVKDGRDFSREHGDSPENVHIVNEEAVRLLGWESPLGKKLTANGRVIGVVENFHFLSKHQKIDPLVMSLIPQSEFIHRAVIKVRPDHIEDTLTFLQKTWKTFVPGRAMDYFFLDESYEALYRKEQKLSGAFGCFTGLAIFTACLGLFGLASFTAAVRTKEIGIRKVLGASAANVAGLLSLEFTRWVIAANAIAWPVAYFTMSRWLQSFAYRVTIGVATFVLAAAAAFVIALLTVSFQAVKAALANPVDSLRYE